MSEEPARKRIVILSGGTGRTANQVLSAALAQFADVEAEVFEETRVRKVDEALGIVRDAAQERAVIVHSLVDPHLRLAVEQESRRLAVPTIDVLGPALAMLGDHFQARPKGRPGLLYELHYEQMDRMDAVDFTMAHDDGSRLHDLDRADVVIVGASRTSKSVTCFFLAHHGVRAANIPLIPGQPPPKELTRLPPRRVIGLTMNAKRLETIRQARLQRISKLPVGEYGELQEIRNELKWVRNVMAEHKWECLDVSYKATEEVAGQIIEMLPPPRRRGKTPKKPPRDIH